MVYSLEYDDKGNVKKSGCVDPAETRRGIWLDKAMTTSRNYTASVTDARNNTVKYTWNESRDQLTAVTDARGNKLSYGYDSANRLSSVSHDVTQNGTKSTVKIHIPIQRTGLPGSATMDSVMVLRMMHSETLQENPQQENRSSGMNTKPPTETC